MACCLTASSHYPDQFLIITNTTRWYSIEGNTVIYKYIYIYISAINYLIYFENYLFKIPFNFLRSIELPVHSKTLRNLNNMSNYSRVSAGNFEHTTNNPSIRIMLVMNLPGSRQWNAENKQSELFSKIDFVIHFKWKISAHTFSFKLGKWLHWLVTSSHGKAVLLAQLRVLYHIILCRSQVSEILYVANMNTSTF